MIATALLMTAWAHAADEGVVRDAPPATVAADPFAHPEPERILLAPGVRVHALRVPGVRRVIVEIVAWSGSLADDPPTWTRSLTGGLRDVATRGRSPAALELEEETLDAWVTTWTDLTADRFELDALPGSLDAGFDLLADVIARPSFPGAEVRRTVDESVLHLVAEAPLDAATLAASVSGFAAYPATHLDGRPNDLDALRRVRPAHLRARAAQVGLAGPVDVIVVGDVPESAWRPRLEALLADWGVDRPRPKTDPRPDTPARTFAVDLPTNDQAQIALRWPAPTRDDPDAAAFEAVAFALNGAFLSRLNASLREEHGLTYGVGGGWSADEVAGWWTVRLDVAEANVGRALGLIDEIVADVAASGVSAGEISDAARDRIAGWNSVLADASSAHATLSVAVDRDRTLADLRAEIEALGAVTPEQTQAAAARWLDPAARLTVVVGDRSAVEPQLASPRAEVSWIPATEAILGTFDRGLPTP